MINSANKIYYHRSFKISRVIILSVFFLLSVHCLSQRIKTTDIKFVNDTKYLSYLFYQDSSSQSGLFYIKVQYSYVNKNVPFRDGGMNTSIGLNLSRFLSDKLILGVCYNFKLLPGFTKQNFTSEFKNDFNDNFITNYSNQQDSIRGDILYRTINGAENYRSRGNSYHNFGICFSPFPKKYGGILIQITKGFSIMPFYGSYPTKNLTKDNSPVELNLFTKLCLEISCKPYNFFNSKKSLLINQKLKDFYKHIVFSIYYKENSLKSSSFNNEPLNKYIDSKFIDKYTNKGFIGIKLGFGLY